MQVVLEEMVKNSVAKLRHHHSEYKAHVSDLLNEEKLQIKSIMNMVEEKFCQFDAVREQRLTHGNEKLDDNECRDVHVTSDANYKLVSEVCTCH